MKNVRLCVNLCGTNIEVTAKYIGVRKNTNWDYSDRPYYQMTVKNTDNGKEYSTEFWGSVYSLQTNKTNVTEALLTEMLYDLLSDSLAGHYTFADFCAELGYKENDKTAEKIYYQCVHIKKSLETLFGKSVNLYKMYDQINETF